jgi:hypothetical protein
MVDTNNGLSATDQFEKFELAEHEIGTECPWCHAKYIQWTCDRHKGQTDHRCGIEIIHSDDCAFEQWLRVE